MAPMIAIEIIDKGIRVYVRLVRNLILILFSFVSLLFVMIEVFSSWKNIQYTLFCILLMLLSLGIIMSGFLFVKKRVGQLIIDKDKNVMIYNNSGSLKLDDVIIKLNSDAQALQTARKDPKRVTDIFNYGNYLSSRSLSGEQKKWELLLTADVKYKVLMLDSPSVQIEPLYTERPLIYESPVTIIYRIAGILQAFG